MRTAILLGSILVMDAIYWGKPEYKISEQSTNMVVTFFVAFIIMDVIEFLNRIFKK